MYLYIFLALWAAYAVWIVKYLKHQITSFKKIAAKEDPEIAKKYAPLRRGDIHKWNSFEIYFCGIFLLPIRLIHFVTTMVLGAIVLKLILLGAKDKSNPSPTQRAMFKSTMQFLSRTCMIAMGFYYINRKTIDISDIDPSYPKTDKNAKKVKAPLVVSNHGSWLDIYVQLTTDQIPGFMAKHAVSTYPLIGDVARGLQCLFVKRESKDGRDDTMNKLKERIQEVAANPDKAQLLIFPEGTTSNGEYILSFKKGAFCNMTPVQITGIRYHGTRFSPAYDTIGFGTGFLFTLCQLYNGVTVYDMGVYDPKHLNLKGEEDWAIYAGKVKNIMVKALNMGSSELGFSDTSVYWDHFFGKKEKAAKAE